MAAAVALALAPAARASGDPTLAAAGDIACKPGVLPTPTSCQQAATADRVRALDPTAVAALGDTQYSKGSAKQYAGSFDPTWGEFKDLIHPVPGNHEYRTPGAAGYFGYFGAAAGEPGEGYYAYDLGGWHVLALNTNCDAGSCATGDGRQASDAELAWADSDLAAHPTACTLAYFHEPLFGSGNAYDARSVRPLWDILYRHGVDLVLSGHFHDYERFAPQDPSGAPTPFGIRELIAGTGGRSLSQYTGPTEPNSEVRLADAFGVVALTLHPDGYDWRFVDTAGDTLDSGSDACHAAPPAPGAATGTASAVGESVATLSGTVDPQQQATSYRFDYGTTTAYGASTPEAAAGSGSGATPVAATIDALAPATTYHYRVVATNAAGTAAGQDATFTTLPLPPAATTGPVLRVHRDRATVTAEVTPQGVPASYHFDYGPTAAYGAATPERPAGSSTAQTPVKERLAGLAPGATYHYRVVATNASGTVAGADVPFTTERSRLVLHGRRIDVRGGPAVRVRMDCHAPAGRRCAGTLVLRARLRDRERVLGRRTFSLTAGPGMRRLALTRHLHTLLARRHVAAQIDVEPRDRAALTVAPRRVTLLISRGSGPRR